MYTNHMNTPKPYLTTLIFFLSFPFSSIVLFSEEIEYNEVMIEKAKVYYLNKEYKKAFEISVRLLDRDGTNVDLLLLCAEAGYNLKEYDKSRECFERMFQVYPEMKEEFVKDYGIVLYKGRKVEEGERLLRYAMERDRGDEVVRYYLGEILLKKGAFDEAETLLKFVFDKKGEFSIPAGILLAEMYITKGDEVAAQQIIKEMEKGGMSELSSQIIGGISHKIAARREFFKKLFLDLSIGIGYDTNSIYLTDIENEQGNHRDSPFSQLSIEMVYNPVIDGKRRLYLGLSLLKSLYFEEYARQFDRLVLNPRLGYKLFLDELRKTQVNFGYEYFNNFFSGGDRVGFSEFGSYYQSNGIYGEINRRFKNLTGLIRDDFSFVEYADHNRSAFENRLILSLSKSVLGSGNVFTSLVFGINDARLNIYDYYSCGANAGFQIPFSKGITLYGIAFYDYRGFFDNPSDRVDKITSFSTMIEYLFMSRYFLRLEGGYINVDSNLSRYSFDKGVVSFNSGFYY